MARAWQSIPSIAVNEPVLFPELPARRSFALPVDGGHRLHIEEWGRPDGIPALVLHGGPGSGCSPLLPRFFDPQRFRVICPDQRGAGRSTPAGSLRCNTTEHLLADLRALRAALGVPRWLVVGGSWGATLALAHALDAPDAIAGLLLRSTFLGRAEDIDAFFRNAPQALAGRWRTLPEAGDAQARDLAQAWAAWERTMSGLPCEPPPAGPALAALVARYRIQSHYLRHGCWLQGPDLLERCGAIAGVPTLLLHGTADRICAPDGARALHARMPSSALAWATGAGHDPRHPRMVRHMVDALDAFGARHTFASEGGQ
ncbi:MAG: prolyl aminopeptidase [Variovorax sp.]